MENSRTPGVSQPLRKCRFQPGTVSRGGTILDGTEQESKKRREASRQTRLKHRARPWASRTRPPPLAESWGNPQPPKTEGCCLNPLETGLVGWEGKHTQVRAGFLFPKKAHFQSSPPRYITYWSPAKYNLSCLTFSLILCLCYDFQETNKKKENTPDFKENLFESQTHL